MNDPMLPLPGLSPVSGKTVVAKFDGGLLSSDGGVLVLREVEQRLLRVIARTSVLVRRARRQWPIRQISRSPSLPPFLRLQGAVRA